LIFCAANTTLQRLDLHNKGFDAAGAEALKQAISAGTGLDHLTLSRNRLGDEGAAEIAAAIPFVREV
jgi:Ran GTPase-activating protein (RanGAP) involved in mRNA processing and transport